MTEIAVVDFKLVLIEELVTDLSTFEIFLKIYDGKGSFILDSSLLDSSMSRFSVIGKAPFLFLKSKGDRITLEQSSLVEEFIGNPFDKLKELLAQLKIERIEEFPFSFGAYGYFSYDLCHQTEELPYNTVDDLDLPDMALGFYDLLIVIDHIAQKKHILALHGQNCSEKETKEKIEKLKKNISEFQEKKPSNICYFEKENSGVTANFSKIDYCSMVEKAREYIRNGDIYQVNLSQRFETLIAKPAIEVYEILRKLNPAPYAAFFDFGFVQVLSSSPESFLRLYDNKIETRPIKGTFPRSFDKVEDEKNRLLLLNSEKDRAENLMIVDLMRNDIGRVCKTGSVKVTELFKTESYATVHHLVSTIEGELQNGLDAVDCLKATFPGGSITGAPKIRAMEIIDELEPTSRSVYTGSIGYMGFCGDMDLNIAIRTIIVKGNKAYYQVGGGIVWDSVPETEYEETLHKGLALNKTLRDQ